MTVRANRSIIKGAINKETHSQQASRVNTESNANGQATVDRVKNELESYLHTSMMDCLKTNEIENNMKTVV